VRLVDVNDERALVRALRAGDRDAFAALHDAYDARMVALAQAQGLSRAAAEESVQDTWVAIARYIRGFRADAALKTWIFRILVNTARAHAKRERRSVPVESNVIDLAQARARLWARSPHEELAERETVQEIKAAIDELPAAQRKVIVLRDLRGWSAEEVCDELEISEANQRVLLHRARTHVRNTVAA
jgi:RNA polymerase sigma-70 factor, ECF subfamily